MNTWSKRRIILAAIATWAIGLAFVVFVINPLLYAALNGLGLPGFIIAVVISIACGVMVGGPLMTPFRDAYFNADYREYAKAVNAGYADSYRG